MTSYPINTSVLYLLGGLLILAALVVVLWQARARYLKSNRFHSKTCPHCGSSLQRIRRTPLDRWLGENILPHARRYRCSDPKCRWSGLRYHESRMHRHRPPEGG